MKTNELRIGNHILLDGDEITVTGISSSTIWWKDGFDTISMTNTIITGIPLTEKWLLKFNYTRREKRNTKYYQYSIDEVNRVNDHGDGSFWYLRYNGSLRIKYVHELQNLYFALTGKELYENYTR